METLETLYPQLNIKYHEPLSHYTYTKTGGKADVLIFPKTESEVEMAFRYAKEQQLPLTILGNASNLIVKDGGIRGVVLILTDMNQIEVSDTTIVAQSGAKLIEVSRQATEHSLTGLEFACGIPGSIGGAVYMNAGAYGGEVCDIIESVTVLTQDGTIETYSAQACAFSYRHSVFQDNHAIVLSTTFRLEKGDLANIRERVADLTFQRESKQPLEYPSCGSVFKRPEGHFAGKLIQDSGLQGHRIGGVEVSTKHAGFMVNVANGTATDYLQLIAHVQSVVLEKFGVHLEPEVKIIGED